MATATSLPDKLEQGSVKGKRSVQSERVRQAFHAELQMIDQEDELKRMKREHEFARKLEEANSRLRKLKLIKQFNERMSELEGNSDPLQYPLWKNAFVSLVDRKPVDQNREYEGSSKCTNVCSLPDQDGKEHCMIVPVWVRHASNPGNEILQNAILDDQSNVGFVSKALCEKMRVDGTDTNLQLTTMHESTRIKTSRICGLEVLDFKKEHVVTLPACYQRDNVPARRSQITKGEVMRRWAHLSPIADDLMPYNPAIEVGLLIGNDCPRAIRPRDIISGGEDEPCAQRSILGWGVVGTVCKSANQEIFCKKTCVKDDYPRFAYANRAKEVFSPERVLNVLEKDIIEMNQKGKPYSIDEMKFMSMLEKGVRKREDGHYEMPLPLKSKEMSLPYNKPLAIKRWNQLTARFRKNQKFQEDYTEFMKGVIADHAERVPPDRLNATVSVPTSERSRSDSRRNIGQ